MLGWDKSAVHNYETRGVTVPNERAQELADAWGLDIITVRRNLGLWVPDDQGKPMDQAEAMLDENERIAARLRSLADDRDRAAVIAAMEAVIDALTNAEKSDEAGKKPR